jgi:type VI secretion system protein ImpJ
MRHSSKLSWGDGWVIRPQADSSLAIPVHRSTTWGVRDLLVERTALLEARLCLEQLSLVLPDGEQFDAPGKHALPEALDLGALAQDRQALTLHFALPDTPANFPLLRVQRAGSGFALDPDFVPPSLSVHGAPALMLQLGRLIDTLQVKINILHAEQHKARSQGCMASFWLLHTASSSRASLSYYFHHPSLHPERLHAHLLGLATSLMGFAPQRAPLQLPAYEHANPGPAFVKLHMIISDLLDTVIPSQDCPAL